MDTDAADPVKTRGLLVFRIGDVDFGARVEDVAGLVEADRLAPLPGSKEPIAGLVDPRVQQHIEQHGLYTSMIPGRRANDRGADPAAGRLHGEG